jgi:hypothetical protein
MEIIIAIAIVIGAVAVYFNRKPKTVEVTEEVPYKVETPAVEETPIPVVETVKEVVSAGVPAAKKPRKPRTPKAEATAKKPAAKKAPAKARATKTVKSKKA